MRRWHGGWVLVLLVGCGDSRDAEEMSSHGYPTGVPSEGTTGSDGTGGSATKADTHDGEGETSGVSTTTTNGTGSDAETTNGGDRLRRRVV